MANISYANAQAMLKQLLDRNILILSNAGAPTSGTSGTYAGIAGPGSFLIDYTNMVWYQNTNTLLSPTWTAMSLNAVTGDITFAAGVSAIGAGKVLSAMMDASLIRSATGTITSANITGTSAGQLGHANGVELVAAGGAHVVNEFISAILINDFGVAAYTGGGNTTINIGGGGAALSGLVSNANFIQSAADKIIQFTPLAATFLTLSENTGINLVSASAPTQPGTAAGVFRYKVSYRQWATGL